MKILKISFIISCILIGALFVLGQLDIGNHSFDKNNQGQLISIGNETIRYSQKGQGKDILLVHGTPGSLEDWNHIVDSLAADFRVTVFDRLGHGYSSGVDYTYHLKDNADLILKLIDNLNLNDPLMVGHSYGGSVMAYIMANNLVPDSKFVIIDSPLYNVTPDFLYKVITLPVVGRGISVIASSTIAESKISEGLGSILVNRNENEMKDFVDFRMKLWSQPKMIYSKAKETINYQGDLDDILYNYTKIDAEVLVLTGSNEANTFNKDCRKFHVEVSKSQLVVLEKTGHYLQIDQSQKVIELIRTFITGRQSLIENEPHLRQE